MIQLRPAHSFELINAGFEKQHLEAAGLASAGRREAELLQTQIALKGPGRPCIHLNPGVAFCHNRSALCLSPRCQLRSSRGGPCLGVFADICVCIVGIHNHL